MNDRPATEGLWFWLGFLSAHLVWALGWVFVHLRLEWVKA